MIHLNFSFRGSIKRVSDIRFKFIGNAKRIITISNSKNDIIKYLGISEDKIKIIYLAADECYQVVKNSDKIGQIKNKYGINKRYLFNIGGFSPNKNLRTLLKAFKKLLADLNESVSLVVVGERESYFRLAGIEKLVGDLGITGNVIFTGKVPVKDLVLLYNAAEALVHPSLYEGFSFLPLEAMACGCPVITSHTFSLPEVVADAAILVDSYNIERMG